MLSAKIDIENGYWRFMYLPHNTDHIYPSSKSRIFGINIASTYWVKADNELFEGRLAHNFAVEMAKSTDEFDYRLLFYTGPDRTMELFTVDSAGYHPVFFPATIFGGTIQSDRWGAIWKAEALVKTYSYSYGALSPQSHQVLALGWERPYVTDSGSEWTALVEWQSAFGASATDLEYYYSFQNDLFLGARYNVGDIKGTEMLFGFLHDLSRSSENALMFEYSRRLYSRLKWEVGARFTLAKQKESFPVGMERQDGQNYLYSKLFYYFR